MTRSDAMKSHSEATATLLPFGSMATHRIGTAFALVTNPVISPLSFAYRRTSASSLPESQQSPLWTRIKNSSRHSGYKRLTVAETEKTAPSASAAVSGSCSAPSSIFHMRTMQSCPPVKARLKQWYELLLSEKICNDVRSVFGESQGGVARSMR